MKDEWTGLTWQQIPDEEGPAAECPSSPTCVPWMDAAPFCANLALDGGGWRLPTVKELATLVDETKAYPAIDTAVFTGNDALLALFWTSTETITPGGGWMVAFGDGEIGSFAAENTSGRVRCVR